MKKLKILTIAFLIFIFNVKAFALDANYKNALKEIDVQKSSQKGYLINLIFEKPYQEPLALKKKTPGEYTILLPETRLASDDVSVLYEAAKGLINFDITQNSYLDERIANNGYVKITVKTKNIVPLSIASGVGIKTNLEKIKKDDIKTITPNIEKKIESNETSSIETKTALEEDITPKTIEASAASFEIPEESKASTVITTKSKIKQKMKSVIKRAVEFKHNLQHKKLIKLGILGLILLAVFNLIIKTKNSTKQTKQSKFAAQSGVLKRDSQSKPKSDITDIEPINNDTPISYSATTFGKMSQRPSYQNSEPESSLNKISAAQNTAQTNRVEPTIQQEAVVKNQSNPFVTSSIEKAGNIVQQDAPQVQNSTIVEEEEIREEAFNPDYPELISQVRISKNKGLYLVNYDDQYSLLGYINDKIFVIKKFESINNKKLQVRVNARTEKSTTYIVRLDNYKALIDVSASNMKTLIEF